MTFNAPRLRRAKPRAAASRTRRSARLKLAAAAAGGAASGALLEYFLDPSGGRRRRHIVRDRALSRVRRTERRAVTRARRAETHALGTVRRTLNARRPPKQPVDDVALAHKVESEVFRRAGVPKGHIDVNAEAGVVFLRGVVERAEDIERMERLTRGIAGVRGVENLLHRPGTPAPASRPKLVRERA
jgi:BON domain